MMSRSSQLVSSFAQRSYSSTSTSRLLISTCPSRSLAHRTQEPHVSTHHFARRRYQSSWAAAAQAASVAQHIRAAPPPDAPL